MEEFTNRLEEVNSKFTDFINENSSCQQSMALQAESCNGSALTSYFINPLGTGSLAGSKMPSSLSSSHLARESSLMDEVLSLIFIFYFILMDACYSRLIISVSHL